MARESVSTLCFQTLDAVERDEGRGRLTFEIGGPVVRPQRVMLGSLEFPMVQYSVEHGWNRVYLSEASKLTLEQSELRLIEDGSPPLSIRLPLHLNRIVRAKEGRRVVTFTTEHPHALWDDAGRLALQPHGGAAWLMHRAFGSIELRGGELERVSEVSFAVPSARLAGNTLSASARKAVGYLHVPPPPSPSALCRAVDERLRGVRSTRGLYEVTFDSSRARTRFRLMGRRATAAATTSTLLRVRAEGGGLMETLGLGTGWAVWDADGQSPAEIPAGHFGGLDYVELPIGWYLPSHRPMGTGAPLRLTDELEGRLNRLAFLPVKEDAPPPCVVLRDFAGRTHAAGLPRGLYDPSTMASALEAALNRATPEARFSCSFQAERFVVSCASSREGRPLRFDLLFTHPLSIDPLRLGFARGDCVGHSRYESSEPVHVPRFGGDWLKNLYSVSESGPTKRLSIWSTAPPVLIGVVRAVKEDEAILETFVGGAPFVHGLQPSDLLVLVPLSKDVSVGGQVARPLALREGGSTTLAVAHTAMDALQVQLFGAGVAWQVGRAVGLERARHPFSLAPCAALPRSLGGGRLGFADGVVQWGQDGSVRASAGEGPPLLLPPFVAPYVHCLDHPDYVLIYLEEGKGTTALQHRARGGVTSPFAKLVLYPLFREERMIPRETQLGSGESLSRFTLRFENPDGTPYHFHGAQFSFTLNLISHASP